MAVPYKYFKQFLPNTENLNKELKKLEQEGWCIYDEQTQSFKTNPIIARVTREKNAERVEQDILPMITNLVNSLEYKDGTGHIEGDFEEIKQFVAYSENIARYPKFIDKDYLFIHERIGNFFTTYGNLDNALKYFEEYSRHEKELYESYPGNVGFKNGLAISYVNLGMLYADNFDDTDKALNYFRQAELHFKELHQNFQGYKEFENNYNITVNKINHIK